MKNSLLYAGLCAVLAAALCTRGAAQQPANPQPKDKEANPPASAPQPPTDKSQEKQESQPSAAPKEKAPAPKETAPKQKEGAAEKQPAEKAPQRADTPRNNQDRPNAPQQDRPGAPRADRDRSNTQPSDRAATPGANRDRAGTQRQGETRPAPGTARDSQNRTGAQERAGADASRRSQKQVKASDLGLSFAEESSEKGLKISKLTSKSIASRAEFKEGDVIVSINDHPVRTQRDFLHWIHAGTDERITVIVLRDDREVTLYLEPDVIFQETTVVQGGAWLGVDLNDRFATAAVVLKVHPGSPAERAGIRSNDVIVAVEDQRIRSPEHLGQVIGQMQPGTEVEVRIDRNQQEETAVATLARRESVTRRTDIVPRRTGSLPRR